MKTKVLISCAVTAQQLLMCGIVFLHMQNPFSHDAAQSHLSSYHIDLRLSCYYIDFIDVFPKDQSFVSLVCGPLTS